MTTKKNILLNTLSQLTSALNNKVIEAFYQEIQNENL
jgi:hypothetical protein